MRALLPRRNGVTDLHLDCDALSRTGGIFERYFMTEVTLMRQIRRTTRLCDSLLPCLVCERESRRTE
jgi:hypothetical protein